MASERLTISEKDRIAKSIIKPIVEQLRKEFEDFGRFADEFFKKNLPKDVIEFMDKYPEVNYFVYSFITDAKFEELKNSTEAKLFVNRMIELDRKASNIKNRTKCALENINTTKKIER